MYEALVIVHSWLRWFVLIAGAIAVVRAVAGKSGTKPWTATDEAAGRWFVISLDVQVLIGLVLYLFLSPYTMPAWRNVAATMGDSMLRFLAVEHLFGMVIGTALAHVGRVRIRKAAGPVHRHTAAMIFFGLALIAILASIPWPFMPVARPLIRGI